MWVLIIPKMMLLYQDLTSLNIFTVNIMGGVIIPLVCYCCQICIPVKWLQTCENSYWQSSHVPKKYSTVSFGGKETSAL